MSTAHSLLSHAAAVPFFSLAIGKCAAYIRVLVEYNCVFILFTFRPGLEKHFDCAGDSKKAASCVNLGLLLNLN